MHLINSTTYELKQYINPGPYAILSHTWHDGEEVLHNEYVEKFARVRTKKGFRKIEYLCNQAVADGLGLAWIDTVCIDKSSSAELSEAINSMFAWYQEAQICYVYLDDVDQVSDIPNCKWITRGWTLQELLAPKTVRFYNREWVCIGTKASLAMDLARCTRIDHIALSNAATIPLHSAATRMSWAASRQTTRIEDVAYCLLGLFGVNMPLLYGERGNAFIRLQEEILRQSGDISILAFDRQGLKPREPNLLAASPDVFGRSSKVLKMSARRCTVTDQGLQLHIRLLDEHKVKNVLAILDCRHEFDPNHFVAMSMVPWLVKSTGTSSRHYLVENSELVKVKRSQCAKLPYEEIFIPFRTYIEPDNLGVDFALGRFTCSLKASELLAHGYEVLYPEPEGSANSWDAERLVSEVVKFTSILIRSFAFVHEQHNEAFIVRIANEISRLDSNWFSQQVWLNKEAKAPAADYATWLKQREIYDVVKQPPEDWQWPNTRKTYPGRTEVIDGLTWNLISDIAEEHPATKYLHLLSTRCYQTVEIEISLASPGSFDLIVNVTPPMYEVCR